MNAVKARDQYQVALALLSELQDETSASNNALQKLFQLVRMVHAIDRAALSLPDKESKFLWQERVANLQDALMPVVAQLLQSTGQSADEFWHGCINLLYTGVEAYEQLEMVKEDLSAQWSAERTHNEELKLSLQKESNAKEAALKENFELRTRLHIRQQDLFQHDSQSRDVVQRLQVLMKERDKLNVEKERLSEECNHKSQILERQATAIAQIMDQCEDNCKELDKALQSLKVLNEENHALHVNMNQHSKVIQNLIHINADLMDAANSYAQVRAYTQRLQELPQSTQETQNDTNDTVTGSPHDGGRRHHPHSARGESLLS